MADSRRGRSRKKRDERRSDCPISCALDIVGDKWTLLIVRDLLNGKKRYGEFLESPEGVPTNILAERLKRLESNGLVEKQLYSKRPARHEYQITEKGEALSEIVQGLSIWGLTHIGNTTPLAAQAPRDAQVAEAPPATSPESVVATPQPDPEPFEEAVGQAASQPEPVPVEETVEETTSMPEPVPELSHAAHDGHGNERIAPAGPSADEVPAAGGNGYHHEPEFDGEQAPSVEAVEDAEDEAAPAPVAAHETPIADEHGEDTDDETRDEVRPGQESKDDSQLSLF